MDLPDFSSLMIWNGTIPIEYKNGIIIAIAEINSSTFPLFSGFEYNSFTDENSVFSPNSLYNI